MSTLRRRWTPETIESELRPLIAELGRLPKRSECEARGLGGMYRAMRKEGAHDFSHLIGATSPTADDIATAAYFMHINGEDGDDVTLWLRAERELAVA